MRGRAMSREHTRKNRRGTGGIVPLLEPRLLLDGNVMAFVAGGNLLIYGGVGADTLDYLGHGNTGTIIPLNFPTIT